jgi:hypothetical protein
VEALGAAEVGDEQHGRDRGARERDRRRVAGERDVAGQPRARGERRRRAPAIPPTKKYHGTSGLQTGVAMTAGP